MALSATAGAGLALEDQVKPLIADGRLVRVLGDGCALFPGCHLYYPSDGSSHRRSHCSLRRCAFVAGRHPGLAAQCSLSLAHQHIARAYRFDGHWSYWASLTKRGRTVGVSANGDGDDDNGDDDDNVLVANRSSCRDYRARNSDSLHSDRTERTSPDCKLRAAPRPGWQARTTAR
jgi:hypothetical protein